MGLSTTVFALPAGWTDDVRVTDSNGNSGIPAIALDSNKNVNMVYQDHRDGNWEIYYTKFDNNGNRLVFDKRLTFDNYDSLNPSIAVDSSNNVHIVWHDYRDTGSGNAPYGELFYTKLDSNGNTLVDDKQITFLDALTVWGNAVAIDTNNNIHIIWNWIDYSTESFNLHYTKLDKNGNILIADKTETTSNKATVSTLQAIIVDPSNNLHITWNDGRDGNGPDIFYKKLDNNGNTLVNDKLLTFTTAQSINPAIAKDVNNNLHLVWTEEGYQQNGVYYAKLDNSGNTLIQEKRLTFDDLYWDRSPALAVDKQNNVHVFWSSEHYDQGDKDPEIYYKKIDNSGNTILDDKKLTNANRTSYGPLPVIDTSNVIHLAWNDNREGNPGNYYKHSVIPKVVMLLHGVCSDPSIWNDATGPNYPIELFNLGYLAWNVDYAPGSCSADHASGCANGDIRDYTVTLAKEIDKVKRQFGVTKVDIVAHSMGGLISRFYMKQFGSDNVHQLIMLGTPNHGSLLTQDIIQRDAEYAEFLIGEEAAECISMEPNPSFDEMWPFNSFLAGLNYDLPYWQYQVWLKDNEHLPSTIYRNLAGTDWPTLVRYRDDEGSSPLTFEGDLAVPIYYLRLRNPQGIDCHPFAFVNHIHLHEDWFVFEAVWSYLQNPNDPLENDCGFGKPLEPPQASIEFSPLETGTIIQGETKTSTFHVDNSVSNLSFSLGWKDRNNKLEVTVTDPDGNIIDRSSSQATYLDVPTRTFVTLNYVKVGNWIMNIQGTSVNTNEQYDAGATYQTQKVLNVQMSNTTIKPLQPTTILSFFSSLDGTILPSTKATATITKPDQTTQDTVELYDDGLHNDGNANDGVFANTYNNADQEGSYKVKVIHYFDGSSPYEKLSLFEVKTPSDVAVTKLVASNNYPRIGEVVTLTATVSNDNVRAVTNVSVQLYENGLSIDEKRVDLFKNEVRDVQFSWTAKNGTYTLATVINPLGQDFEESNYDNNRKSREFILGIPNRVRKR